jgi:hypothetical protein
MRPMHALVVLLIICTSSVFAQQATIRGIIKDSEGQALPFVSVYLKNTTKGTSANIDGAYSIRAEHGSITLIYRAIGYRTVERVIQLTADRTENIMMEAESFTLKDVTIRANAEDPAYTIMRKALKKRKAYLNEIDEYAVDVYIKGMQKLVGAPKSFMGRDMQKTLDLDSNRKGILYLSESQSVFNFKRPGQIYEEMISSKIAGRNNAFSFNKASDVNINFYNNVLLENTLSARGSISPLADNALLYYRYKLLGITIENGETINKIAVIPRRQNDPVFRGTIYIADDSWRLISADLYLTKDAGINLLDTLNIAQQSARVKNTYMPSNISFRFNGGLLGFKFQGYFLGVYSNYNLKPGFPPNYFKGEVLKITDSVNKKDTEYWVQNRPMPLTAEENISYIKKDSVEAVRESKPYLDSVQRVNNQFTIKKIILPGYTIADHINKSWLKFDPLLRSVHYNTVEGFTVKYGMSFTKRYSDRRSYTIRPEIRYGFANQLFTAQLNSTYNYEPLSRASIGLNFGSGIYDLNNLGTMSLLQNSVNSLLFERNFPKFYKKDFINLTSTRELANGLQASAAVTYANNSTLENHTDYKIKDHENRSFTSNNPFNPIVEIPLFPNYKALVFSASIIYTYGQKYISRPDGKYYEPSKFPTLRVNYRKGIKGITGSDVDYDLIGLEISKNRISAGMFGYSQFHIGIGKFINNRSLFYPELQHFRGNNTLAGNDDIRKFSFLDFYAYSTDREYLEAHFEHNFSGLLINKIPLVRKLKLEELAGVNYLTQPMKQNYTEYYFGLQRLLFKVTYGFAYNGQHQLQQGFKIYYGF